MGIRLKWEEGMKNREAQMRINSENESELKTKWEREEGGIGQSKRSWRGDC